MLPEVARSSRFADVVAGLIFVACALLLFRLSLSGGWTFVGDSDRLNTVLNVRLFEVLSILQRGSVPTWSEQQFMGYGIVGLHWMLPGAPPIPQLLALLPTSELYHALAFLAAGLLACAMAAAYWALGPYSTGPVQRIVGAVLYATGAYTVHKLMQLDLSFAALVAPPILHRLVHTTTRERAPWTFLGMAACWAFLVLFTVLQEIAYIGLFWGLYALYRSLRLRDPCPLLAVDTIDIDDRCTDQQRHQDGGLGRIAQFAQVGRQRPQRGETVEIAFRQPDDFRAEAVAGRAGVLFDETGQGQGAQEAVDRGQRHARALGEIRQLVVGRSFRQEVQEQRGVPDRAERSPVVVALHGRTLTGKRSPTPGTYFHIVKGYDVPAAPTA